MTLNNPRDIISEKHDFNKNLNKNGKLYQKMLEINSVHNQMD